MRTLDNKIAIVTGGSRGIGKAVTSLFLEEGAKVVIVSRTAKEIEKTCEELEEKGEILGITADISAHFQRQKMVEKTLKTFGSIDILVNCAAIQQPIGPFLDIDWMKWIKNINVNLLGTVMCCKAVLPTMIKNKGGKIINFSGGGAVNHRVNFSAYAVSKAAVVRFTEQLAVELKENNINVNAVAPGAIETRMIDEAIEAGEKIDPKKMGNLKDAAELVLFLASKKSDNITGRLISAVWDDWRNMDSIKNPSLYTLRRIDGRNFNEVKLW